MTTHTTTTQTAMTQMATTRTTTVHRDITDAAHVALDGDRRSSTVVANRLYEWYVNRTPLPQQCGTRSAMDITPATALRAAHSGSGRFVPGWSIVEVTGLASCIAVADDGTERHLLPGEFRRTGRGAMRAGERVLVEAAWSWVEADTGFWLTRFGPWVPPGSDALARVYVNVTPHQALDVIAGLSHVLMRAETSFIIKTPAAPTHVGRADALVLYLGLDDWPQVRDAVIEVGRSRRGQHRSAVPRFSERLAPGIGWGMGRLDGESFGKLRCDAIGAKVAATQPTDLRQAIACVERALETVGVDSTAPHCETGRRGY